MPRKELGMAGCNSGSCDSMVSTASNHSQHSDNSYDYLSVEEKECLMFLEETIGSLDAEADSGVSTNETDYTEPSKLPGTRPKRNSITRDLENGAPLLQHAAEQNGKNPSAFPRSAPAVVPSSGYSSLPRITTVANGASDSKVTVHRVEDPVPGEKSPQEMAKDRLDQPSRRSQMKSLESLLIQPPDPFQDELGSHEWSRSNRSDDKRETAKETKTWMSWGQPEKSTLEEAPQDPDTKRGPPTAPKPRKLPPNIILKTSKTSPVALAAEPSQKVKASPPSLGSDATAEKVNSGHLDPKEREKARREALEKLGLSQDRREPSAHLHPTAHPHPKEVPFPTPAEPEAGDGAAERSVPGVRQITFKSNTLERSGVGLSSYMASAKEQSVKTSSSLGKMSFIERLAPSFLRSSRPRPVSLGTGKDFAGLKEPGQAEQEKSSKRRSHPLQSFPRPPRSSVSVKISPKGATDENRREALKKLGLLKE
ncbi:specifically androgen-regulated gene protein [Pezoporus flaviventris]|uniref:specifically androgen-regulated gene protein n=1 Tax=Pezoporus flaviventris TaxID=889875 RepID=UPI002AAF4478|nr:specifically androgen-regulated gene protein [Pezoporus flaviventris]XP_061310842.1 specifically androgen-regulated gene protein [Pezoporus flaviventris]XP_061310843.1 specifically androgen-regulated gene protein [Pezoporus flaviventris]